MAQSIREVMQPDPICLAATTTVAAAAGAMRDAGIGDVIVQREGEVCGIVTDRDIVVRVVAEHSAPEDVRLGDICSRDLTTLAATDTVEDAVRLMADHALRRLPVVDRGQAVGIVSLGDLAIERDPESALASISGAPANR